MRPLAAEKYRRRILNPGVAEYTRKLFPKVLSSVPDCEITELNIQPEHIHIIMVIPPRYSVSSIVGKIKGETASMLRKKFSWLKRVYWAENNVVWSPGYFVSTIGLDEKDMIEYVKYQEHQDSGQARLVFR